MHFRLGSILLQLCLGLIAALCLFPRPSAAQSNGGLISIEVSKGRTISLAGTASSVFVADPGIADVQTPSARTIYLLGKAPGRTTLIALGPDERPIFQAEIEVVQPVGDIDRLLRQKVGDYGFTVSASGQGLLLAGVVPSAAIAERLVGIAGEYTAGGQVENRLKVAGAAQVKLKVRVAEVSRSLSKQLGFNWDAMGQSGSFAFGLATGRPDLIASGAVKRAGDGAGALFGSYKNGSTDITGVIDALAEDNLVSLLAEPSLTALTGEKASFLAGGEFPVPVVGNDGQFSVDYRSFGVSLVFVPLVVTGDRISLQVRPEVSELSTDGAIQVNGFSIPAIRTRRAETTVDLGSGQSFAIAGLLQNSFSTTVEQYPGLADVPVIGALFRSTRFQRKESELLIIVTPYLVTPVSQPNQVLPTDLLDPPTDIERILFGTLGGSGPHWRGPAGFMVE